MCSFLSAFLDAHDLRSRWLPRRDLRHGDGAHLLAPPFDGRLARSEAETWGPIRVQLW